MTDVDEGQATIPRPPSLADENLIALLVPPRRPRRHVVFAVVIAATIAAGVFALAAAGAVVPRLDVWIDRSTTQGKSLTVVFRVRNQGSVDVQIRSLDARSPGLAGMRVVMPKVRTVGAHHDIDVAVRITRVDCTKIRGANQAHDVRLHVKNSLGVTFTHSYPVKYYTLGSSESEAVGPGRAHTVLGEVDQGGWARSVTQRACATKG